MPLQQKSTCDNIRHCLTTDRFMFPCQPLQGGQPGLVLVCEPEDVLEERSGGGGGWLDPPLLLWCPQLDANKAPKAPQESFRLKSSCAKENFDLTSYPSLPASDSGRRRNNHSHCISSDVRMNTCSLKLWKRRMGDGVQRGREPPSSYGGQQF